MLSIFCDKKEKKWKSEEEIKKNGQLHDKRSKKFTFKPNSGVYCKNCNNKSQGCMC